MPGRTAVPETTNDHAQVADPRARSLEDLYLRHVPEAVRLAFGSRVTLCRHVWPPTDRGD